MRTFWILIFVFGLSGCGGEITETLTTYTTTQTSNVVESSSVSPQVTEKPDLTSLDSETQSQINILCQDEYFEGTIQYWNCLDKELKRVQGVPKPDLSYLDSDVRSQINILCQDEYFDGTIQHRKCLGKELKKIDGLTRPDIGSVDSEIQSQVRIVCQDDYFNETVGYWNCLRKELNKIGVTPPEIPISTKQTVQSTIKEPVDEETVFTSKPDMSGLSELDTLIIDSYCEWYKGFGIQSYWRCLDEQIKESKTVNSSVLETLRDKVDKETRDIILPYCESFVRFGIGSYYNCLNEQVESIGVK